MGPISLSSLPCSFLGVAQVGREMLECLEVRNKASAWINTEYTEEGDREKGKQGVWLQIQNLSRVSRAWSCHQGLGVEMLCSVRWKLTTRNYTATKALSAMYRAWFISDSGLVSHITSYQHHFLGCLCFPWAFPSKDPATLTLVNYSQRECICTASSHTKLVDWWIPTCFRSGGKEPGGRENSSAHLLLSLNDPLVILS